MSIKYNEMTEPELREAIASELNNPVLSGYTHGKRSTYTVGRCRGPLCTRAHRDYFLEYQRKTLKLEPTDVPETPARMHDKILDEYLEVQ